VAPTNGFFADIDLQAGTIGTCTAIGNGTATSAAIAVVGRGYWFQIIGKCSSGAASPNTILAACSAAGTTTYTGDSTENFDFGNLQLITASSISDTTFSVADDTGWLSGDAVAIAPTQRTYNDSDAFVMSANAGASSVVSHEIVFGDGGGNSGTRLSTYSGTSPTQAELGLLTRNVIVRGSSSATTPYIYLEPLCSYTAAWAWFYWIGSNNTGKQGTVIAGTSSGTATAKSITYCSFEWCFMGVYFDDSRVGGNSFNATLDHSVMYYATGSQWVQVTVSGPPVGALSDITITNNLIIRGVSNGGILLNDPQIHCSGNVCTGCVGQGIYINSSSGALTNLIIGKNGGHDSNVCHTNQNYGIQLNPFTGYALGGLISNPTCYRNGSHGIFTGSTGICGDVEIRSPICTGNATSGIANQLEGFTITGQGICAGDSTFAQTSGLWNGGINSGMQCWNVDGLDMSGSTSIYVPNATQDINITSSNSSLVMNMRGCKFGASKLYNSNLWGANAYIGVEQYNQVNGDHRCFMGWGQTRTDQVIYNSVSPSQRVWPTNAANKTPSQPKQKGKLAKVKSGDTLTVSVPVYKSQASDGSSYNGNQPRLILRANAALGVYNDQVLATYSAGTGSWNTLSGVTPAATDTGEFEFVVDCDGTQGWINIDNPGWQVTNP
jgi:hypothetical protein